MNDLQENRLSAAKSVQLFFQQSDVPRSKAQDKVLKELDDNIGEVDGLSQKQGVDITGVPEDKKALELKCIAAAIKIVGPAISYAKETGNNTLKSAINYSENKLKKLRDTALKSALLEIAKTVRAELANLKDYDVTEEDVKNLEELTEEYNKVLAMPRVALSSKSSATKQLRTAFTTLKDILQRLDGIMLGKKSIYPEHCFAYKKVRKSVGNKGGGSSGGGEKKED